MAKGFFRKFSKQFFILCNIIVAILFLLGCYAYLFNPTYFWFVGFLTLGAPYILLVLIGFILFWLFAKKKLMLISFITILLAIKPIAKIIPLRFSKAFDIQKSATNVRIMSWNVDNFMLLENKKNPELKAEMLNLINKYNPDIACFQEMVAADTFVDLNNEYYRKYAFYP
ncbi:MAG: endonuclease/exonuclease/phosphatase family protein, partial [Ferruginibacter sp.]